MKKNYKPINGLVAACLFLSPFFSFAGQIEVNNTNNLGAGSLNEAIATANSTPGVDTIYFNLPEGFSMTIAPTTPLPTITEAVFINGYTQPGASMGTVAGRTIRINVSGFNMPTANHVFTVGSTGVEIAGLAIYQAPQFGSGINIPNGFSAFIWGNYIGTDSTGLSAGLGNSASGIVSNFLSGAPNTGIIIGVNDDGVNDANEGNLISCNGEDGIFLWNTQNSTIAGNVIGLTKNGTVVAAFRNLRNGILITSTSNGNTIGTDGDGNSDALEANWISNNTGRGILIGTVSNNNVIAGNTIGLDATGAAAGNGVNDNVTFVAGVEINPGSTNRIGTNADGVSDALERNIISSNLGDGIRIVGGDFFGASNSNGNIIAGNSIGTDAAGTLVRGNGGNGVTILSNSNQNANNNIIGSDGNGTGDALEGNLIANNAKGIVISTPVAPSTHVGNRISRNAIYNNTQLGIDLHDDGVTANDNGDADAGSNDLFNFPFITRAHVTGGNLTVAGIAPAGAIIEFYIADANGSEGETYLFTAQEGATLGGITDDTTGTGNYSDVTYGTGTDQKFGFTIPVASLPVPVTTGTVIIALSINTGTTLNSTSEFGPNFISTLPVRFVQFNGRIDNGVVHLNWSTSQELNNSHFEVERSSNGSSFQKAGSVAARDGNNNDYSFTDSRPLGNVNFYRLKQVDKNGASTYSKTILLRSDLDKGGAKITPNPFTSAVNVSFQLNKAESISIRLYNQNGQLVKQTLTKANAGINTVNISDLGVLPAGNYTVELRGETVNFRQQVVKQ
jgi:hypothetical protein